MAIIMAAGGNLLAQAAPYPSEASLPAPNPAMSGSLAVVMADKSRGLRVDTGITWMSPASGLINVREFGVTGDGSTDDRASIQTALNVSGTYATTVFFPAGTYSVTRGPAGAAALLIPSNTQIVGAGRGATVIKLAGGQASNPSVLKADLRKNITLRDLAIDGNSSAYMGAVVAPVGSLYLQRDGTAGATLYVKESGTGNTGSGFQNKKSRMEAIAHLPPDKPTDHIRAENLAA